MPETHAIYSSTNKATYDLLADEYEERVRRLRPVCEEALAYFSSYVKPGGEVLDIGCAVGSTVEILAGSGFAVTGIEISPKMAAYAQKRNPDSKIVVGDFLETDFRGEKFDGVLIWAFIHLFPKALMPSIFEKIKSILKDDGIALVSTTESAESKEGWYSKDDFDNKAKRFRKFWTERELRETLDGAGLKQVNLKNFVDSYGKKWMDFIVRK